MSQTRTTVSIEPDLHKAAMARMEGLGMSSFSEYVATLLWKDVVEDGPLVRPTRKASRKGKSIDPEKMGGQD